MKKKLRGGWEAGTCRVFRAEQRTPLVIDCKKASYDIDLKEGGVHTMAVTAFLLGDAGPAWAGPEQEYYIETESGVVGFQMRAGNVFWCESLASRVSARPNRKLNVDDVIIYLDGNISGDGLMTAYGLGLGLGERTTDLLNTVKANWFFTKAPLSSFPGDPKIVAAEMDGESLVLDLTSEDGALEARVGINVKTLAARLHFVRTSQKARKGRFGKELLSGWNSANCRVFRAGQRTPSVIDCMSALYEVDLIDGGVRAMAVTTFLLADRGVAWAGSEQEYYIELEDRIVGFQMRHGNVFWCDSLASGLTARPNRKLNPDDVLIYFGENVSRDNLLDSYFGSDMWVERTTDLRSSVKSLWLFTKRPYSTEVGNPKITSAEMDGERLNLDLTSENGEIKATVRINVKTRAAEEPLLPE